jgi:hypothetical protein
VFLAQCKKNNINLDEITSIAKNTVHAPIKNNNTEKESREQEYQRQKAIRTQKKLEKFEKWFKEQAKLS